MTKKQIQLCLLAFLMVFGGIFIGYCMGYRHGTGLGPFLKPQPSAFLPDIEVGTFEEVSEFLEEHDISMEDYDIGFNCIEFAFLQARTAHWKGIEAVVVRIILVDETKHAIIGFPTEDEGWVFVEPQSNTRLYPRVGGDFMGQKIVGVYYLYDFVWRPCQ